MPYQGEILLQNVKSCKPNSDPIIEHTGDPSGENEQYPSDTDLPTPKIRRSNIDLAYLSNNQQQESCKVNTAHIHKDCIKTNSHSNHDQQLVHNFFTSVSNRPVDNFNHSEYPNIAHELKDKKSSQEKHYESQINLSVFILVPFSIHYVPKLSPSVSDQWGDAIRKEIQGLFDNGTFLPH